MEWWTVLRLIDVLGGLSRAADLGFGLPPGEATRSAAIALLLGRSLDLPDQDVQAAAYAALLLHLGCISYSHETAEVFGNELVSNAAAARTNVADPRDVVRTYLPAVLRGHPPLTRIRLGLVTVTRGKRFSQQFETAACEVGRDAARRLRLAGAVQRSVYHSYERWNGGGVPAGLAGEEIPMGSRLAVASSVAALFDTVGGSEVAADGVRRQAGSILDPDIAGHLTRNAGDLLREVNSRDPHALVLELEPPPVTTVPESQLAEVATVFGDVVDLKTPFTHGHARGVAALARGAGERLGLPAAVVADLEVAALVHDLGRVAVPTAVWEKAGPLVAHEWEQVRLHAYHSERIVAGSERLAPLARLVGSHHERLDASGYHRGCGGAELTMAARVLAAADAFHAMGQRRPHRAALEAEQAEQRLLAEARAGLLDPEAVNGVLAAAGRSPSARREIPAGLTEREVEVLALVAQGCTNAQIGERLVISRRTAEHHVQHIYTKIGVSSRPAAVLFAMEHDLLPHPDR